MLYFIALFDVSPAMMSLQVTSIHTVEVALFQSNILYF